MLHKHILAPTDGSEAAQKGGDESVTLAKALAPRLTVVTATERVPVYPDTIGLSAPVNEATLANSARARCATPPTRSSIPPRRGRICDLIAMASHGRRGLGRLLLGSKTAEVVARSPAPVLVLR